jgi:DNA-binding transcriptional MerR regulator
MKIGQFIETVQTTKDTVRHYEALNLLKPAWENTHRIYGQKEVDDFLVIKEMQMLGLSLQEIQVLFELKKQTACGDTELIHSMKSKLEEKRKELEKEEARIKERKMQITEIVDALNSLV